MPILTDRYTLTDIQSALLPKVGWSPFPTAADRHAWLALSDLPLNRRRADFLVGRADALAKVPFPVLSATEYMRFIRTGDRALYEAPYFERRNTLGTFVLAECFTGNGRFIDPIINAAWAITEEATWCLPAHATRDDQGALHTQSSHTVDLFAAETGMVLAEALYLIKNVLPQEAKALADRIKLQIIERIIVPFETQDFGWYSGRNNWSPWCSSNIAGAAMYVLDDPDRLAKVIHKCMVICDAFIDKYSDDGGCDEGPTYWAVAPGALLTFLELIHSRSSGRLSIYDAPKLQRMVSYIANAYMGQGRGLNFADAPPRISLRPYLVHQFAKRVNMPVGSDLAALAMRGYVENGPITSFIMGEPCGAGLNARLREIFWLPSETPAGALRCDTTAWLPHLQVLIARQSPEPEKGITFAIKAGHNQENHNHNDLGHFVIYVDGHPGIIDVGVETYTRKTFSAQRYDIWCIRGAGHNAPVFGDIEQSVGRTFACQDVSLLTPAPHATGLTMRLDKAYPDAAGLSKYIRTGMLLRDTDTVTIEDDITFSGPPLLPTWTFYTLQKPTLISPAALEIPVGPRALRLTLPLGLSAPEIQSISVQDPWLKTGWGDTLHKVTFQALNASSHAAYLFKFKA
jgi:hypothetical protein